MARTRKRSKTRDKERAERRELCEFFRAFKEDQAQLLAEYGRQVDAGAVCPVCGCPLVDPESLVSCSVMTPEGIVHEACA